MLVEPVVDVQLDYHPRWYQSEMHIGLTHAKRGLLIWSRQIGKTVGTVAEISDRVMQGPPNCDNAYLAPTQNQARKIAWPTFKAHLAPLIAVGGVVISETMMSITFPGNRVLYCLGAESGENLRGLSLRVLAVDERDSISDVFWRTVVLPMLNEYEDDGFILYIGTLGGGGNSILWRHYIEHRDDPEWYCSVVKGSESGQMSDAYLAKLRREMGDSAFLREIECDPYSPVEHSVLGEDIAEAEREGRICPIPYQHGVEVFTSYDLGIRDFTTVWGFMLRHTMIDVLFYREFSNISLESVIGRITSEFRNYNWGMAILPHDAKIRDKGTLFSVTDLFVEQWPGYVQEFKSGPSPVATLQAARRNMPRCRFDERGCEHGINRLKQARYVVEPKTGTVTDKIVHDDASHGLDGWRYGMYKVESMFSTGRGADLNMKRGRISTSMAGSM